MLLFMEAIPLCYFLNKLKPSCCVTKQTEAIPLFYLLSKLKPPRCVTYWTNWSHHAVLLTKQTALTL